MTAYYYPTPSLHKAVLVTCVGPEGRPPDDLSPDNMSPHQPPDNMGPDSMPSHQPPNKMGPDSMPPQQPPDNVSPSSPAPSNSEEIAPLTTTAGLQLRTSDRSLLLPSSGECVTEQARVGLSLHGCSFPIAVINVGEVSLAKLTCLFGSYGL